MKQILEKHAPRPVYELARFIKTLGDWRKRQFLDQSPQFVKEKVFLNFAVADAPWVETGTFMGSTTSYLLAHFPKVFTVEPEPALYARARERFKNSAAEVINGTSEEVLPGLLATLSGPLNFWLDGHYSAGVTYKGATDCPVVDELAAISDNLSRFGDVAILIDDVRCFSDLERRDNAEYPPLDWLVDWAREHGFKWAIVHDIFIMRREMVESEKQIRN